MRRRIIVLAFPGILLTALVTLACGERPAPDAAQAVDDAEGAPTAEVETAVSELTTEPYANDARGAIEVDGEVGNWFSVVADGKPAYSGAPPMLNQSVEVDPGSYLVEVNKSRRTVTVAAGQKVILRTGTLVVEGENANFWAPFEGDERRVAINPPTLGTELALFAGSYGVELDVGVNQTVVLTDAAQVVAGKKTVLHE